MLTHFCVGAQLTQITNTSCKDFNPFRHLSSIHVADTDYIINSSEYCGQKQLIFSPLFWQLSVTCDPVQCVYSVRVKAFLIYHCGMVNVFISASSQSCHDKLIELFSEKLYLIGLAALVVAVIMVSSNVDISHCCGVKRLKSWPNISLNLNGFYQLW